MGGSPANGNGSSTSTKKTESGDQMPEDFTRLAENLQARKLEREAETQNFLNQKRGETIKIGDTDTGIPKTVGGTIGIGLTMVRELALKQQARELRRGGTIVRDQGGDYVGVFREGRFSGKPEVALGQPAEDNNSDPQSPQVGSVTPEVTPEIVPDDATIDVATMPRGTRGTQRTRRAGQAGTFIEGYGVLTRGKGERSVV